MRRRLAGLALMVWAGLAHAGPIDRCVNLSNFLEAPEGEVWGPEITDQHLDAIRAAGFDTVRLPVRFSEGWDGKIDPTRLARADATMEAALERGLNVIVVLHHFEALMTDPYGNAAQFRAIWEELSTHWADAPEAVMFEMLNEPNGALTTERAVALFAEVLPIIRTTHPTRWIILEGGDWARWTALRDLPNPDPYVIHSFHYYDPYPVTHQLAPWAFDGPMPALDWNRDAGGAAVSRDLEAAATATDAPLFLGEFGVYRGASIDTRVAWTEHVRREAERLGMGWCIWGFASDFNIFDVEAQVFLPEMEQALLD